MKVISKLEQQKRHPDRVNIYLDGEFAFGVNKEVAHKYSLRKGASVKDDLLKNIIYDEELSSAKKRALKYLERRMRSEQEMRSKLLEAAFPDEIIDSVVRYLKGINCLDDRQYAIALKNDLQNGKSAGKQMIRAALKKRGISDDIARGVLDEIGENEDEIRARDLAEKLIRRYKSSRKTVSQESQIRRISQALARRGYTWSIISKVIKEATNQERTME